MSLSHHPPQPARSDPLDEPSTMPLPAEPVAWRRWADAMPDICLWLAPTSGRIVDCNRALFSVLGFSRAEVFGWPLQALAEPSNLDASGGTWRSLAACRELRDADCMLRSRHGFDVAVSATGSPVHNEEGKLVAGLVVMRDITERRHREQTLQMRKRQLKTLAYELMVAETRERGRIALTLHDDVDQRLALARMLLQQIGGNATAEDAARLSELDELLDAAMRSTDSVRFALACPQLQPLGLQAAIEDLAQRLAREGPLIVQIEGEVPKTLHIPDATRAVMFRVLHEVAVNAIQHAKARHLWFRMQTEPERLGIIVADDGVGFDIAKLPASSQERLGLFSADAQMQAVGGRLIVQSKPGQGTRAMVVLPLVSATEPPSARGDV